VKRTFPSQEWRKKVEGYGRRKSDPLAERYYQERSREGYYRVKRTRR
jgi:hypothetical protein